MTHVSKIVAAHAHIEGILVSRMILEFMREFRGNYGNDTMTSSLCAVGPLQSMIGLAIKNGLLSLGPNAGAAFAILKAKQMGVGE